MFDAMSEQRRSKRRPIAVEFHVREADDPHAGELVFDTVDLSADGVFLRSDLLLDHGDVLEVSFAVPGLSERVQARARVAWTARHSDLKGQPGMGLEFIDLDAAIREALVAYLKQK